MIIVTLILFSCGSIQNLQDKIISEHPEWSIKEVEKIRNGEIDLGMTKEMVKAAWGKPRYINETDSQYTGKVTAWSYIQIFGEIKTVSFQNDKVTMYSNGSSKNY